MPIILIEDPQNFSEIMKTSASRPHHIFTNKQSSFADRSGNLYKNHVLNRENIGQECIVAGTQVGVE